MRFLVLILLSSFVSVTAMADATVNWKGDVLEATDFFQIMTQKFKDVKVSEKCLVKDLSNRQLVGDVNPDNGSLYSTGPTPQFWGWYIDCLSEVSDQLSDTMPSQICEQTYDSIQSFDKEVVKIINVPELILNSETQRSIKLYRPVVIRMNMNVEFGLYRSSKEYCEAPWSSLNLAQKNRIIKTLIPHVMPIEIIKEKGVDINDFIYQHLYYPSETIPVDMKVEDMMRLLVIALLSTDAFIYN